MSHPLKAAFHELSNVLNSEILLENERKRRGRPRRKENSLAVKELQKRSRLNYFYNTNPEIFQQAINSFKEVFNKYKDVADITKKATNCLNCTVKVIICMGLLKSGDDNDWEKTAIDLLTLIENFIQQGDGDREMLGKLCLKPLIETLTNSSLPTDLRKTSADVINAFLTGCKENKKLLSQEQFFDASDLVSSMVTASDYELQLCHLEILFRLCPRVQEDRKTFVNKAFMIHKDMIQKFLAITVDDFFGVNIRFSINEADDSVDNDMLEIKYSKILTWDLQIESKGYVLRLYLSGHLKLGSQYSVGTRSKRIFSVSDNEIIVLIRFDNDVKDDLKIMFADRRVEKKMQPSKVPISPVLQQKFDNVELNLSKSSGTLITPKNGTQIDKQIIKLLKDVNLDNKSLSFDPVTETKVPQNCIAAYNTGPSFSVGNPLEKQIFKNSRITPTTPSHSYTKLQIFDAECHNIFQSRRRSKSLNLKKQTDNKRDNIKEDNKLSNMVKKGMLENAYIRQWQDTLQNQDDDFIMMELNNEADHVINEQEFRFYGISNLASADNIKNPNHGKRKRKSQDSIEDNLKKPKFNNIIKKNREQIKVDVQIESTQFYQYLTITDIILFEKINNNRSSPIKSEDEFWNPPKNDTTGPTEDEVIERMRAQFPMECFRELMGKSVTSNNEKKQVTFIEKLKGSLDSDDEEINNGQYILHTRDSSLTISSNNETTKQCSENATYDNKVNDVTPINSRYANEKFDEEIKRLLQCVGETIFRQFRSQDAALFQETQKKIIQNETSLAQELKTQFKRKNQLLDEFKRNYTSIAIEDRQMIKKLKEGRKELASLEQTLLEMEKTESGISKI
ncbi:hypothetical protein RclHR1_10350003 [Rhizophagus clarus]|uniref:Uncharacterized protein n=1 Tax=Rhizophagus clarus TaxID=94130 RepID=A0A2Z6Q1J9_9GLOM|nr:hypothetical protein RclHR1_10350003 [Rhizophagus clarus]